MEFTRAEIEEILAGELPGYPGDLDEPVSDATANDIVEAHTPEPEDIDEGRWPNGRAEPNAANEEALLEKESPEPWTRPRLTRRPRTLSYWFALRGPPISTPRRMSRRR